MRATLLFLSIVLFLYLSSCVSNKALEKYAAKAKEPGTSTFVITNKGDTITGNTLKVKARYIVLDGKSFSRDHIRGYQDKSYYVYDSKARIVKGKLELYMSQTYERTIQSTNTQMSGHRTTTFYFRRPGGGWEAVTYNVLLRVLRDCPSAMEKLESEFRGTYTKNHPNWATNHYPKLIPVIEAYNNNNECK